MINHTTQSSLVQNLFELLAAHRPAFNRSNHFDERLD
jgi:hypothetical protein